MWHKKSSEILVAAIILMAIDAILIWFLLDEDNPIDAMTSAFVIMPLIASLNLLVAVVLFIFKQKWLAWCFMINLILAPVIYDLFSVNNYKRYRHKNYQTYHFNYRQRQFEVEIEKQSDYYSINDISDQPKGLTTGIMLDRYKIVGDTIFLLDSVRRVSIVNNTIKGYPDDNTTIKLIPIKNN